MEIEKNNLDNKSSSSGKRRKILSDNYVIVRKIGSGSFGEVYVGQDKNGAEVAAKVEERTKTPRIINEYRIYQYLQKCGFTIGLPKIYEFIQTSDYNIMFMQLLGPSLDDLLTKYNKKFSLPTVMLLADQTISLLNNLHNTKFLHRDIKPNNFLIGKDDPGQVYIMDFGLSKKYISNGSHIKFRDNRSLIGTARYASINMHMGFEPSRRDDLESLGYMFVYFLKGSLPWQGLKKRGNAQNSLEAIGEVKMSTSLDTLCTDIPECFKKYIQYCRKLKFDEVPDYKYLKGLFQTTCLQMKIIPKYEWIN